MSSFASIEAAVAAMPPTARDPLQWFGLVQAKIAVLDLTVQDIRAKLDAGERDEFLPALLAAENARWPVPRKGAVQAIRARLSTLRLAIAPRIGYKEVESRT